MHIYIYAYIDIYMYTYLWRPLGSGGFCVAGVGQSALSRSDVRSGVPLASLWLRWLLRGRRGTICTAAGSDVRPGVPLVPLGLRRFCVAGVAQRPLPRGRMYALAPLWLDTRVGFDCVLNIKCMYA